MLKLLAWTLTAFLAATSAMAQDFPQKRPVKIVVPFSVGGLTDLLARITAEFLQKRLGQAVIVENKPGAAGAIAADYVAKSPADGYTLMMSAADLAVLPAVRANLPYKLEDFTYLTRFWTTGTMIVVGPKSQFSTLAELIAYMKANPGKVVYGTAGVGSLNHLGTLKFEGAVGVKGLHVPYPGAQPVYGALQEGSLDFYTGASLPFPDSLKVLAPAGSRRHPAYPNLPTLEELGFKGASYDAWFGIIAPGNLPKPVADRINAELRAVYQDPEAIARFRKATQEVPDPNLLVGDSFRNRVLQERKTWKEIADREKVVLE